MVRRFPISRGCYDWFEGWETDYDSDVVMAIACHPTSKIIASGCLEKVRPNFFLLVAFN